MDVNEAIGRLRNAHAAVGLGSLSRPGPRVETALTQLARAVAPLRVPTDLIAFWLAVDPDSISVAPCPRPAGPELALRLWREHLAPDWGLASFLPWCYESHDFTVVALDEPEHPRGECFGWAGGGSPVVRTFVSVAAYLDLLATMIELREFVHHVELGVLEFDPARRWPDAQAVRLAAAQTSAAPPLVGLTSVADLLARAESGQSPSGVIRARVVAVSCSASGQRLEVSDGTGRLDVWCPASLCGNGPVIDRRYEFDVMLTPGCQQLSDSESALNGVERATRSGDLRAAVMLATPLYDALYGTPAKAEAVAIRPL